jgi:membrane-associated phospholipid phosphatase
MFQLIQQVDEAILLFIQEHIRSDILTPIMKGASFLGDAGLIWILAAVLLLTFRKTRRGGFDVALSLALASIVNNLIIKNLVARPRPFMTMEGLQLLIEPLSSYSFPSGHSCSSFAAATAIALSFKGRGGAWAFLPAALVALSRVYVGIHYPTDVLCGSLLGVLCSVFVYKLSRRYLDENFRVLRKN